MNNVLTKSNEKLNKQVKKMKKYISLILCAIMLVSVALPIYADGEQGAKLQKEILGESAEESEAVKSAVEKNISQWAEYIGSTGEEIDYELMFRVYYLESNIVSGYAEIGSFEALISENYCWLVPNLKTGGEVQVVSSVNSESGWAVRQGGRFHGKMAQSHNLEKFDITDIYSNILAVYPDAQTDSFKAVYDENRHVLMLYFENDGKEYVSPYFHEEDIDWITNGAVYRVSDFVSFLDGHNEQVGASNMIPNGDEAENIFAIYIIAGTAAVIVIAFVAVMLARKKKS